MKALGIDIGGSGIKAAVVDLSSGEFAQKRIRIPTPRPATVDAVDEVLVQVKEHFNWPDGARVGVGFPGVIECGVVRTAANMDSSWVDTDAIQRWQRIFGRQVALLNDADAAGLAEVHFGAAQDVKGLVVLVTIGTGLGTALLYDGQLIPNSELGHLLLKAGRKKDHYLEGEKWAADSIRQKEKLSWKKWGKRLNTYLNTLHDLLWPELILLGGGAARAFDRFEESLDVPTQVIPATLRNKAGIIGAALATPVDGIQHRK